MITISKDNLKTYLQLNISTSVSTVKFYESGQDSLDFWRHSFDLGQHSYIAENLLLRHSEIKATLNKNCYSPIFGSLLRKTKYFCQCRTKNWQTAVYGGFGPWTAKCRGIPAAIHVRLPILCFFSSPPQISAQENPLEIEFQKLGIRLAWFDY